MAPVWPEEVDVFSVPHSRMKELVRGYLDQVTVTNFSDAIHLTTLLQNLCNTFREFKVHEQIENKYILCKLRQKLNALSIRNSAVCNCHSDNRLTEMMKLVKDGFDWMSKPQAERTHYGFKLQKALEDFTVNFIPHMEEEEAIFQPMLIEYFSYDELKAIKAEVIYQHLRKGSENYQEEKFVEDTKSKYLEEVEVEEQVVGLNRLPDEVVLNMFSYLSPADLSRCAQVSKRWKNLSQDGSLWAEIHPVCWAKGMWNRSEYSEESDYDVGGYDTYIVIDEDADIDESPCSEFSSGGDENVRQVKKEVKMLLSLVKYQLPVIGDAVKTCNLAYSRGVSNGMVKRILNLCPNLERLILRQTRVTDVAFKLLGQSECGRKLKHIDLSGCENVTDVSLERISSVFRQQSFVEQDCNLGDQTDKDTVKPKTEIMCSETDVLTRKLNVTASEIGIKINSCPDAEVLDKNLRKPRLGCPRCSYGKDNTRSRMGQDDVTVSSAGFAPVSEESMVPGDKKNVLTNEVKESLQINVSTGKIEDGQIHNVGENQQVIVPTHKVEENQQINVQTHKVEENQQMHVQTHQLEENQQIHVQTHQLEENQQIRESNDSNDSVLQDCLFENYLSCGHPLGLSDLQSEFEQLVSIVKGGSNELEHQTEIQISPLLFETEPRPVREVSSEINHLEIPKRQETNTGCPLEYLNFSGCHRLTDTGIRHLIDLQELPELRYLDLSSCLNLTGQTISELVSICPELDHSQLFYCDNLSDDPFPDTASGCRNVECQSRFCCRK